MQRYPFDREQKATLASLWRAGAPFYLQVEVGHPYPGCRHEPNIYLVNPKAKKASQTLTSLYSSGHGMNAPGKILSYGHLISAFTAGELGGRRWEYVYATEMGPINEALDVDGRYWTCALQGLHNAGIAGEWICEECGETQTFDPDFPPTATGYTGDGGVGVYLDHIVCETCLTAGTCSRCSARGSSIMESWHPELVEHGHDLCRYCVEEMIEFAGLMMTEAAIGDALSGSGDDGLVRLNLSTRTFYFWGKELVVTGNREVLGLFFLKMGYDFTTITFHGDDFFGLIPQTEEN